MAINKEEKQKCICTFEEYGGLVFSNIDCPVHGALHGKNPYAMPEESVSEKLDTLIDIVGKLNRAVADDFAKLLDGERFESDNQIAKRKIEEFVETLDFPDADDWQNNPHSIKEVCDMICDWLDKGGE